MSHLLALRASLQENGNVVDIGIGSYTYIWAIGIKGYARPENPLSSFELLERARDLGVRVVQICDNLALHELPAAELDRLHRMAQQFGLAVEVGTRGIEPELLLRYLDIALALGSKLVRTVTSLPDRRLSIQEAERLLGKVLPAYEREDVVLALENYEAFPSRDLAELVQRLDGPCLGVCVDTVNSFGAMEDTERVVEWLLPHAVSWHVKDFTIRRLDHRLGYNLEGAPAGQGSLDLPGIVRALRQAGKDINLILELWTPYAGSVEETIRVEALWAGQSLEYLRQILG